MLANLQNAGQVSPGTSPGTLINNGSKLNILAQAGLRANDQHAGGQVKLIKRPAKGKLTLRTDGSFTYKPPTGFVGKVTFKYHVFNAFAVSVPVVVTIKVK